MNPEDVVLLAIAYELKSPRVGEWTKQGWTEGWKNLGYAFFTLAGPFVHLKLVSSPNQM